MYCYHCGKSNVTVKTCLTYAGNAGGESLERISAPANLDETRTNPTISAFEYLKMTFQKLCQNFPRCDIRFSNLYQETVDGSR